MSHPSCPQQHLHIHVKRQQTKEDKNQATRLECSRRTMDVNIAGDQQLLANPAREDLSTEPQQDAEVSKRAGVKTREPKAEMKKMGEM
jgi:hypothetical protein